VSARGRGLAAGVTGARADVNQVVEGLIATLHSFTDKPVAVGFGVSGPAQVRLRFRCMLFDRIYAGILTVGLRGTFTCWRVHYCLTHTHTHAHDTHTHTHTHRHTHTHTDMHARSLARTHTRAHTQHLYPGK
jgi:Tryptophan synthase alpha chain